MRKSIICFRRFDRAVSPTYLHRWRAMRRGDGDGGALRSTILVAVEARMSIVRECAFDLSWSRSPRRPVSTGAQLAELAAGAIYA